MSLACLDLTCLGIAWLFLLADWSLVCVSFPQLLDGVSLCCADPGSPHFQPIVDASPLNAIPFSASLFEARWLNATMADEAFAQLLVEGRFLAEIHFALSLGQ